MSGFFIKLDHIHRNGSEAINNSKIATTTTDMYYFIADLIKREKNNRHVVSPSSSTLTSTSASAQNYFNKSENQIVQTGLFGGESSSRYTTFLVYFSIILVVLFSLICITFVIYRNKKIKKQKKNHVPFSERLPGFVYSSSPSSSSSFKKTASRIQSKSMTSTYKIEVPARIRNALQRFLKLFNTNRAKNMDTESNDKNENVDSNDGYFYDDIDSDCIENHNYRGPAFPEENQYNEPVDDRIYKNSPTNDDRIYKNSPTDDDRIYENSSVYTIPAVVEVIDYPKYDTPLPPIPIVVVKPKEPPPPIPSSATAAAAAADCKPYCMTPTANAVIIENKHQSLPPAEYDEPYLIPISIPKPTTTDTTITITTTTIINK